MTASNPQAATRVDKTSLRFCLWLAALWTCATGWIASAYLEEPAPLSRLTDVTLQTEVGERIPSDDEAIKDFHSLGLVRGHTNIFRSACPVRDLAETPATKLDDDQKLSDARTRMRRLYALGIRTIISFEEPKKIDKDDVPYPSGQDKPTVKATVALEKAAAESEGLQFLSRPIRNAGRDSLEDMSTDAARDLLETRSREILACADSGGVLFHCSAGHDRAGIVTAYMRIRDQHWPLEEAIAEMRRYGHNWPKFSRDGGESSWHEAHLRAISPLLSEDDRQ